MEGRAAGHPYAAEKELVAEEVRVKELAEVVDGETLAAELVVLPAGASFVEVVVVLAMV